MKPGEDYRGRFVVALFGEVAPMTVMNYVALTRGYKRGKVWCSPDETIFNK